VLLLLALVLLVCPVAAMGEEKTDIVEKQKSSDETQAAEVSENDSILVLSSSTNKVTEIELFEYVVGAVAAEMPATYHSQALKAQAVVAYTYFLNKKEGYGGEYDITDDFTKDQAFVSLLDARKKWGSGADEYEKKIRKAIKAVKGQKITYEGKPILAVYHAVSSGKTENVSEVWGGRYPYLVSVDSSWDKEADNYESSLTVTAEELKEKLASKVGITDLTAKCFSNFQRTSAGSVKTVSVCGVSLARSDIRSALGLRSADFDVEFADGKYTFTVRGYGHGIGMSQQGANYLAKQNKNYREIINHYYTGCTIE
jgi:stage II sporulation protein D